MDLVKGKPDSQGKSAMPADGQSVAQVPPALSGFKIIAPPRCFDPASPELIDRPGMDPALLREELQVLESTNARFGNHRLVLHCVQRLVRQVQLGSLSVLDLATGAADIPRVVVAWARERRLPIAITAVDLNPEVVGIARDLCRGWPEIRIEQHDLLALPYEAKSFDLVLCSLALHHFASADVAAILRRMQQIARLGYFVSDLRRNWPAIWIMELVVRAFVQSRIVRQDGPQSARAAFTLGELRALAQEAGLDGFRLRRNWWFRMVLEGREK